MLPENGPGKKNDTAKAGRLIRCECGYEILLIPDLEMMRRAIETHASEHGKREKDHTKAAFEEERIQDLLIVQTLNAAVAAGTEEMGDSGELSGKVDKVEEKISTLQKEVTSLLSHLSSASQEVLPKQASVEMPKQVEHTVALLGGGPLVVLRCKQWSDFQTLAAKAQTLSFNIKQEEKQFQVDALKNNQLITYTGELPMLTALLKTYLSSQLNISEQNILEGILSLN